MKNKQFLLTGFLFIVLLTAIILVIPSCLSVAAGSGTNISSATAPNSTTTITTVATINIAPIKMSQQIKEQTSIDPTTGEYGNYYLGIVNVSGGVVSGDGCYDDTGDIIVLIDNKNAINPGFAQLKQFLNIDKTDEYPYVETGKESGPISGSAESHVDLPHVKSIIDGSAKPSPPDVCADFAERLHNDAEMAGIRCAFVIVDTSLGYHALNAFQTTDAGLVFIDDTGVVSDIGTPSTDTPRCVKTVDMEIGQEYVPMSMFPYVGWSSTWDSMGKVLSFQITWDGTWDN